MKSNVPLDEMIQKLTEQKALMDKHKSHPKRKKVEEFLCGFIRVIDGDYDMGVLISEWVDGLDLPENLIGRNHFGQLQKIALDKVITPELKKIGYCKIRSNCFQKASTITGNTITLLYGTAPLIKAVSCKLIYKGCDWQHSFDVTFTKGYSSFQFGIMSVEHLQKAINNHICILQAVEKEILSGLDKIYHED
jgi:hypothetical protein